MLSFQRNYRLKWDSKYYHLTLTLRRPTSQSLHIKIFFSAVKAHRELLCQKGFRTDLTPPLAQRALGPLERSGPESYGLPPHAPVAQKIADQR